MSYLHLALAVEGLQVAEVPHPNLILLFTYLHSQGSRKVQTQPVPDFCPGNLYSLNNS